MYFKSFLALAALLAGISAAAQYPAPAPIAWGLLDTTSNKGYTAAITVPGATPDKDHVVYAGNAHFTIIDQFGNHTIIADGGCTTDSTCPPTTFQPLSPAVFLWVSAASLGVASTEGTATWSASLSQLSSPVFCGVLAEVVCIQYEDTDDNQKIRFYSLKNGTVLRTFDSQTGNLFTGCDPVSGMCLFVNDTNSICAAMWNTPTQCVWQNTSNFGGSMTNTINFGYVNTSKATDVPVVVIGNGVALQTVELSTGIQLYAVNFDGTPYNPNNPTTSSSSPYIAICGDNLVAVRGSTHLLRLGAPGTGAITSAAIGIIADVFCDANNLLLTFSDTDDTKPSALVFDLAKRTVAASYTTSNNNQDVCGVSTGFTFYVCGATRVMAVNLVNPQQQWYAFSPTGNSLTYLTVFPNAPLAVFVGPSNSLTAVIVTPLTVTAAFPRNETIASFGYDATHDLILSLTTVNDGLSIVNAQTMEIEFDTAIVAGDDTANTGSSNSGSGSVGSPTIVGQAGVPPFTATGSEGKPIAIAPGAYTNGESDITCFTAFSLVGVRLWQYCLQGSASFAPLVASTSFFVCTSEHLYGVDTTTGKQLWAPLKLSGRVNGLVIDDLETTVFASVYSLDMAEAYVMAASVSTGTRSWQTKLGDSVGDVFPAVWEGGILYVCLSGSSTTICVQVNPQNGYVAASQIIADADSNLVFTGGRCIIAQQAASAGIYEIAWGDLTQSRQVVTIPAVPLQTHKVKILAATSGIIALQVTVTESSEKSVSVWNLHHPTAALWTQTTAVHLSGNIAADPIQSVVVNVDSFLVVMTCTNSINVFDFYSGSRLLTIPLQTGQQLVATVRNGTLFVALGMQISAYSHIVATRVTNTDTLAPLPDPTLPPTTTTTTTTRPPTTTTTTTTPAPWTNTPPDPWTNAPPGSSGSGSQSTPTPWTPEPTAPEWNPAAVDAPGSNGAVIGGVIGGLAFAIAIAVTCGVRICIYRQRAMIASRVAVITQPLVATRGSYVVYPGAGSPVYAAPAAYGYSTEMIAEEEAGSIDSYPGITDPYSPPPSEKRERGKSLFGLK